ncbi:hypothetical protein BT93_H3286 [Corymbia citriodora subsp. variegata]|nr:hypothetical protein BT93_H3286 [Corymbia citriodora subsp. variegata]
MFTWFLDDQGLCYHMEEEHHLEASNGRKRKSRKGGSHSTPSLLRRGQRGGTLQSLLGGGQEKVTSSAKKRKRSNQNVAGSSKTSRLEGGYSRKRTTKPASTRTGRRNKTPASTRTGKRNKTPASTRTGRRNKTPASTRLVTRIVFDLETTGFSSQSERIIEIALQDFSGGKNSTFQSLVNPERSVPNAYVHGITTHMVSRPDVPRMKDLIPMLLQFVRSCEKSGGLVLFIAHNARRFDVPFLLEEFNRNYFPIPANWLFMDTLPLAREVMESKGTEPSASVSLQSLREYYGIRLAGSAHRAMSDVKSLSAILRKLTRDLKILPSDLVQRSFKATDLNSAKRKKNSS